MSAPGSRVVTRSPVLAGTACLIALAVVVTAGAPTLLAAFGAAAPEETPAPEPAGGEAHDPMGAIVGAVRDWDGGALAGARVRLPEHGLEAVTDEAGRYHFYTVPPGPTVIRAEADGFEGSPRTVHVRAETIHEVNLRLATPASPPPAVSVHVVEGRLDCTAVAIGVGVNCADAWDHDVPVTGGLVDAVVEVAWDPEDMTHLNASAGSGRMHPVTGRPSDPWASGEGTPLLTVRAPGDVDRDAFTVSVRPAANATGVPDPVSYVGYVTVFHDRPAPPGYSAFAAP